MSYSHHRRTRQLHGFTLVELLVVIGIIALLVSILLPSLKKAHAQAQAVQCASNLRQIHMALNFYARDNDGWIPQASGHRTNILPWTKSAWEPYPDWMRYLYEDPVSNSIDSTKYLDSFAVLQCPTRIHRGDVYGHDDYDHWVWPVSYALSVPMFYGTGPWLSTVPNYGRPSNGVQPSITFYRLAKTKIPAEMYLVADDKPKDNYDPGISFTYYEVYWPGLRHSGRTNMVFHDGHVESLSAEDLTRAQSYSENGKYMPWRNVIKGE